MAVYTGGLRFLGPTKNLRSHKNRKFYAEVQAITNHVVWQYIRADNASCCRLTISRKIIIYTIMGALTTVSMLCGNIHVWFTLLVAY